MCTTMCTTNIMIFKYEMILILRSKILNKAYFGVKFSEVMFEP